MAKFNDEHGIIYDRVRKQRQNLLNINVLKNRLRETTRYGINIFAIRNALLVREKHFKLFKPKMGCYLYLHNFEIIE